MHFDFNSCYSCWMKERVHYFQTRFEDVFHSVLLVIVLKTIMSTINVNKL